MTFDELVAKLEDSLHLQLHGWRKDFLKESVDKYAAAAVAASHEPAQAPDSLPSAADLDAVAAEQSAAEVTGSD